MKSLIHSLWTSPPPEATDLQKQAHRLMLQTLQRIEKHVEGVLAFPKDAGGERVMDAAMAASLNPRTAPELRSAALSMLQQRMAKVDAATPQRIFMLDQDHQNPISDKAGDDLEALRAFEAAFHQYLSSKRLRVTGDPSAQSDAGEALLALGVLEAMLVVRLGCCSLPLLGHVAEAVKTRPSVATPWAWVDIKFTYARDPVQLRRIFLDPVSLAAWIVTCEVADKLAKPALHAKSGERRAFQNKLAARAFVKLAKEMASSGCPTSVGSLRRLCELKAQHLRVTSMPLLATFAEGAIVSSSLEIGTWARLIGCGLLGAQEDQSTMVGSDSAGRAFPDGDAEAPLPSDTLEAKPESFAEQTMQGDLEEDGIIAELREIMRGSRQTWRTGFDAMIRKLTRDPEKNETARCVVSWLRYLAFERRNKGRLLSDGSVRNYRGLLANRLLVHLPPRLRGIDEDELQDVYLDVLESQSSEAQGGHINAAFASFHQYVRRELIPDLPRIQLAGNGRGGYAISSRIISEAEFQRGYEMIRRGRLGSASDVLLKQTEAFWILAFRLGMRRREILGLQVRDVDLELVRVRKNQGRVLKTANARRVLPVCVLSDEEAKVVLGLVRDRGGDEFLFFGQKPPSAQDLDSHRAVATVNELLKRLTGDSKLHPHNLRHSTATSFLFGSLGSDLGFKSHPYLMPWMEDCFAHAEAMEAAITGELHRKGGRGSALAMTMGHGSEITTYQHYVHCLDLLLFLACTSGKPELQRSAPSLSSIYRDREIIAALLGCSSNEIRARRAAGLVDWVALRRPSQVVSLAMHAKEASKELPTGQWPIALEKLMGIESGDAPGKKPKLRSQIDAAAALLDQFNRVAQDRRELLRSVLQRWAAARMEDSDWASMKSEAAVSWIKDLRELGSPIAIDAMRVTRPDGKNRKQKTKIARPRDPKSYRAKGGIFWLRFSETTPKLNRHHRKTGESRSRAQASITWMIAAVLEATRGQQELGF